MLIWDIILLIHFRPKCGKFCRPASTDTEAEINGTFFFFFFFSHSTILHHIYHFILTTHPSLRDSILLFLPLIPSFYPLPLLFFNPSPCLFSSPFPLPPACRATRVSQACALATQRAHTRRRCILKYSLMRSKKAEQQS